MAEILLEHLTRKQHPISQSVFVSTIKKMQVPFQYVDLDINYLTIILKLSSEFIVKYPMQ